MAFAAVFGKILQIGGGLVKTRAGLQDALGAVGKMKFDADVAERNAELAGQDIVLAGEAGNIDRANISNAENETRGAGRAGFASGNVAVDEGSALEFDIAVAEQAAIERERSKDDQAIAESRLKTEETGLLAEAHLLRRGAKRTKKSAKLGAVGGALQAIGGGMGGK